jgi:mono/diheme cytochrome c family protein
MWLTNLKVGAVVLGTIIFFTLLANAIPQVQSEVPEDLVLTGDVSPEELAAAGEQLYHGAGACSACHGTGARAPNLITDERGTGPIGVRCGERVAGMSCQEYLYESLVDPNAYIVAGYDPIMPDASRTLSATQIWALVAYMESLGGEITVTADDIAAAQPPGTDPTVAAAVPPGTAAAATAPGGLVTASLDPLDLLRAHQCLVCHQLRDEGSAIGPPLDGIGARMDAAALRAAILDPAANIAAGYETLAGVMPANFGSAMTAAQLEAMVNYLAGLR